METPKTPHRNVLSLDDKIRAVKLHDGGKSCNKIAKELGCGATQIKRLMKRKRDIMDEYENNSPMCKKRLTMKKTGNEEINRLVYEFFSNCSGRHINITGPMIQEKALQIAQELGVENFKASNGWLESFKKRHNIHATKMSGKGYDW